MHVGLYISKLGQFVSSWKQTCYIEKMHIGTSDILEFYWIGIAQMLNYTVKSELNIAGVPT